MAKGRETPAEVSRTHLDGLERMYERAAVNRMFPSELRLPEVGHSEIRFEVTRDMFHAAGAAHGVIYFKMLDDAAFYAANSVVTGQFVLTTQFNLFLTRPLSEGPLLALGKWASGKRRMVIAEARLVDMDGEEVARGQGTFVRSHIALDGLPGYLP